MDLNNFNKAIQDAALSLSVEATKINVQVGLLAKSIISQRVQQDGLNADNSAFEDYTEEYKKRKEKAGKYTDKVDFTLSGRMWKDTNITYKNRDKVIIGGLSQETKDKLSGNTSKKGSILELSEAEMNNIIIPFYLETSHL